MRSNPANLLCGPRIVKNIPVQNQMAETVPGVRRASSSTTFCHLLAPYKQKSPAMRIVETMGTTNTQPILNNEAKKSARNLGMCVLSLIEPYIHMTNNGLVISIQSRYLWPTNRHASVDRKLLPAFWNSVLKRAIPLSRRPSCMVRPLMMFCPPFNREVLP